MLPLVSFTTGKGAEGAEVHTGICGIATFFDNEAVNDPVDPVIVRLFDQHGKGAFSAREGKA